MKTPKAKYKKGQVVFNLMTKTFGCIEDVVFMQNKGHLYTIQYANAPSKEEMFRRYYSDRIDDEFLVVKGKSMASILFGTV